MRTGSVVAAIFAIAMAHAAPAGAATPSEPDDIICTAFDTDLPAAGASAASQETPVAPDLPDEAARILQLIAADDTLADVTVEGTVTADRAVGGANLTFDLKGDTSAGQLTAIVFVDSPRGATLAGTVTFDTDDEHHIGELPVPGCVFDHLAGTALRIILRIDDDGAVTGAPNLTAEFPADADFATPVTAAVAHPPTLTVADPAPETPVEEPTSDRSDADDTTAPADASPAEQPRSTDSPDGAGQEDHVGDGTARALALIAATAAAALAAIGALAIAARRTR